MRKIALMLLGSLVLAGCATTKNTPGNTLKNVDKFNEILPVVESLVMLQDNAKATKQVKAYRFCEPYLEQKAAAARVMGWVVLEADGKGCTTYTFKP